jgi:diguanylate cyclase (GGDEF)-like protein/PAS domain S-box-containing protein
MRLADGGERDVLVCKAPLTDVRGETVGVVGTVLDVSELKSSQKALEESGAFWKTVLNEMNDSVAIIDAKTLKIVGANKMFTRLFGTSPEEAVGRTCHDLAFPGGHGAGGVMCPLHETVLTRRPALMEHRLAGRDGKALWLEVATSPVIDGEGELQHLIHVCRDITPRKEAEGEIERLAYFDRLTELPNRTLFADRLAQALNLARREGRLLAVLLLDIDHFKKINDSLGYGAGDQTLETVAKRLRRGVRQSDTLARTGGDEFAAVLTSARDVRDVLAAVGNLQEAMARPLKVGEQEVFLDASIGIALFPEDGSGAEELLRNAELAMYEAKGEGRNTYQFYSAEMNRKAFERLQMEVNLRQGLRNEEFFLAYQPQISLEEGRVTGVEALLRWGHPHLGTVSPGRFIPLAEETGLILPLGEWALREGCRQARAWREEGFPFRLGVNLSPVQFRQADLPGRVRRILKETGLEPAGLELELTESVLMEKGRGVKESLEEFRSMGVSLAIDDFGTGYSSLSYLRHFPIRRIKIAQEFIRDFPAHPGNVEIVKAIMAMARSLELEVVAEGVERKEQLELLSTLGCREIQGFYFSRPLRAAEIPRFVRELQLP